VAEAGDQARIFRPARDLVLRDGAIPLTWWVNTPNIGDLLSPFLVERMTGLPVVLVDKRPRASLRHRVRGLFDRANRYSYLVVGSIISRADAASVVWGSGAFGTELGHLSPQATYLAVRGPLTRNLLRLQHISCPEVYGDPALLLPLVFAPPVEKKYRVGVVRRWREEAGFATTAEDGVKIIDMGASDVEAALLDILSCELILASSLHGLVLADAYGIPSAWLPSNTPKGLEYKYYDYFATVAKLRKPQRIELDKPVLTLSRLETVEYDDRPIEFDRDALLGACPFIDS
jgi:hypothetical protein